MSKAFGKIVLKKEMWVCFFVISAPFVFSGQTEQTASSIDFLQVNGKEQCPGVIMYLKI